MRELNDWTIGGKAGHGEAAGGRWTALRERMLDGLAALLMLGLLGAGLLMPRSLSVEGLLRDTLARVAVPFGEEALRVGRGALLALFDGDVSRDGAADPVRALPAFARLEVHGGALRVTLRPGAPQLRVEGEEALRAQVRTEVEDGLLRVFVPPAAEGGVGVELSAPALGAVSAASASTVDVLGAEAEALTVQARGGSRVRARGLHVGRLDVVASGGGTVELEGTGAQAMHARAAGGGAVLAAALPVRALVVSASGAARVEVNAATRVEARMVGASSLVVHGQPEERLVLASRGAHVLWQ